MEGEEDEDEDKKGAAPKPAGVYTGTMDFSLTFGGPHTKNPAVQKVAFESPVRVPNAVLWNGFANPGLYAAVLEVFVVLQDDEVNDKKRKQLVDVVTNRFGFRKFEWTYEGGFFLNDVRTKITGFCHHESHAGLGVALPDDVHHYRVAASRDLMGANAWRMSHNVQNTAILDKADEIGMLVKAENHYNKNTEQYNWEMRTLVRRDRNRASLFLWSICNEHLCCPHGADSSKRVCKWDRTRKVVQNMEHMKGLIRELDPKFGSGVRAITAGCNKDWVLADSEHREMIKTLDVVGMNYWPWKWSSVHQSRTVKGLQKAILATEASAGYRSRGEYYDDHSGGNGNGFGDRDRGNARKQCSVYDVYQKNQQDGWHMEKYWCELQKRDFI
eukprot:g13920.t1